MNGEAVGVIEGAVEGDRRSSLAQTAPAVELGLIRALWLRDTLRLSRERSRWLGLVVQPLILWAILGAGLAESFQIPGFEHIGATQYLFPGLLAMVLLFTSIFSTMSVIEDRHSGFLQAVIVGPASPLALVLGKVAGVTTIVLIQAALFLLAAPVAGYPYASISWPLLFGVLVLCSAALTCANFVFAWVLDSTQAYHAMMGVVLMPLWIVSGAMFPPPSGWMGTVVALNPMTYGVAAIRAAMGMPVGDAPSLTLCVAVLALTTVVSAVAATRVMRRR